MKYFGKAKITDPTLVQARAALNGGQVDDGSIYCECPELGFEGSDLLYCRYGLSIPYIRVQVDDTVWIEPTINNDERWIYTGFADCGGNTTPVTADQLFIKSLLQAIYMSTAGTMHLSSKTANEAFVKGTSLLVKLLTQNTIDNALKSALSAWNPVAGDGGAALKAALATYLGLNYPSFGTSDISTKIFGE